MVALLLWVSTSQASLIVNAGDHQLQPNTPAQQVKIQVTGGDSIAGLNLYLQVGDGTTGPQITGIDLLDGTIFEGTANFGQFGIGNGVGRDCH